MVAFKILRVKNLALLLYSKVLTYGYHFKILRAFWLFWYCTMGLLNEKFKILFFEYRIYLCQFVVFRVIKFFFVWIHMCKQNLRRLNIKKWTTNFHKQTQALVGESNLQNWPTKSNQINIHLQLQKAHQT